MEKPSLSHVEKLLRDLQSKEAYVRKTAAEGLGLLSVSNEQIVRALVAVSESDDNKYVRNAAADSLLTSAHQGIIQEHSDLMAHLAKAQPSSSALSKAQEPPASNCWFCQTRPAIVTAVDEVKLNYLLSRVREGNMIRTTYKKASVDVPRCVECQSAHKKVWNFQVVAMCFGLIVSIIVGILIRNFVNAISAPQYQTSGETSIFFTLFIAFVVALGLVPAGLIVGRRIGETRILHPKKIKSIDTHGSFPGVLELTRKGWKIGEAPWTSNK